MPSHAAASRPRAQKNIKSTSRRKRRAPSGQNLTTSKPLTPAKATPPRPKGPEHPRFKKDVVTSIYVASEKAASGVVPYPRKRASALTRSTTPRPYGPLR